MIPQPLGTDTLMCIWLPKIKVQNYISTKGSLPFHNPESAILQGHARSWMQSSKDSECCACKPKLGYKGNAREADVL